MLRRPRVLLLLAPLLLLAGPVAGQTPDPCALLTAAEVTSRAGVEVLPGAPSNLFGTVRCEWPRADRPMLAALVLEIEPVALSSRQAFLARLADEGVDSSRTNGLREGPGDHNFFDTATGTWFVAAGAYLVQIQGGRQLLLKADTPERLAPLAAAVVGRLP